MNNNEANNALTIQAIKDLLGTLPAAQELEEGRRWYISSEQYGKARYHVINTGSGGIQIEQTNIDEQWSKRVNFAADEFSRLLAIIAYLHLKDLERSATIVDNELDNLDDHPF